MSANAAIHVHATQGADQELEEKSDRFWHATDMHACACAVRMYDATVTCCSFPCVSMSSATPAPAVPVSVPATLQHPLNCLTDANKLVRKKAIQQLNEWIRSSKEGAQQVHTAHRKDGDSDSETITHDQRMHAACICPMFSVFSLCCLMCCAVLCVGVCVQSSVLSDIIAPALLPRVADPIEQIRIAAITLITE